MDRNVKLGIVGIGNIGSSHAQCTARGEIDGVTLVAVCDIDPAKVAAFRETFPQVEGYSDYLTMFRSGKVDAVIISVPHPLHSQIAIQAFQCGLHVLLEKPADISVSKVMRMNEVAREAGTVFSMMFNQRTNYLFAKARELVRSGQLGDLKRSVWIITNWYRTQSYYDSGDWRATWAGEGGGVLINQAPHNLDLWQWICGMPKSITAFCDVAKYHRIEVEDDVTILARYENGAVGTFITSTGEYPGTNRLEISGTLGKLVIENSLLKWWKLKTDEREVCATSPKGFAKIDADYEEITAPSKETAHKGIIQNFANAILHGEPLLAPGTDGIYELTLSNAAYLSGWKKGAEITLPFDVAEFDELLAQHAAHSETHCAQSDHLSGSGYNERWSVQW